MLFNLVIKSKYSSSNNIKLELKKSQPNYIKNNNVNYESVYSNLEYYFEIESDESISDIKLYINNKEEKIFLSESKILFLDDSNNNIVQSKKVFNNYYGYVYLSIEYAKNNETYRVYSDWLDIYIKNDDTSDLIKPMEEYIYNNSSKYLYKENSNVLDYSSTTKSKNKNMYTKISLLEKIVLIYTENLKFFKNYVHYENIEKNIIDDFEKLNIIKGDTIQFILSNPQYLKQTQSITGIKYNKTNLIPIKTLINKNEISKNIYENKIVLGFLKSIYLVINDEINILSKTRVENIKDKYNGQYISSGYHIHEFILNSINSYLEKLYALKKQFLELYLLYKKVLKCDEIIINKIPKPNANFIKIKHYQKIYLVIKEWFENGNYDFKIENMILSFNSVSEIYEYYVLLNINEYLIQNKFDLIDTLKIVYTTSKNSLYINTRFENTFIFKKNDIEITVFYQPLVSSKKKDFNHLLGLFRNNNINYQGERSEYYTPDYIIKINRGIKNEYISKIRENILKEEKRYNKLKKVIQINFDNFNIYKTEEIILKFEMMNEEKIREKVNIESYHVILPNARKKYYNEGIRNALVERLVIMTMEKEKELRDED